MCLDSICPELRSSLWSTLKRGLMADIVIRIIHYQLLEMSETCLQQKNPDSILLRDKRWCSGVKSVLTLYSSDNFQDQMKRELSYREEMVQQLHIVRGETHEGGAGTQHMS